MGLAEASAVEQLEVGAEHIAVQYHVEPHIDVFDRKSRRRIFRLEGSYLVWRHVFRWRFRHF